jgi:isocitrate dehydrogenase (NAD+)
VPHRVTLIPGDGIGPEVCAAARLVLDATGIELDWDVQEAGAATFEREGSALPPSVLESIRERGVALKGPTATGRDFRSANLSLREELDLYAGVRPVRGFAGVGGGRPALDLVIVRMNHEDLYAGIEYPAASDNAARLRSFVAETAGAALPTDAGVSLKPLSASGAERVARLAFDWAETHGRRRVTAVHKATVMRATDGAFLEAARAVAAEHPRIEFDDLLVDAFCAKLVRMPERFDVLLLPVLYGDIASDLAAALIGGLGLAPGANLGDRHAVFEAVHGTAPRHAGQGKVNPLALVLSGSMLLQRLGEAEAAERVERAVAEVLAEGRTLTYDLGGSAGTTEVAEAVAARL